MKKNKIIIILIIIALAVGIGFYFNSDLGQGRLMWRPPISSDNTKNLNIKMEMSDAGYPDGIKRNQMHEAGYPEGIKPKK